MHSFDSRGPLCKISEFENDFFNRCVFAWDNNSSQCVVISEWIASFEHNFQNVDSYTLNCALNNDNDISVACSCTTCSTFQSHWWPWIPWIPWNYSIVHQVIVSSVFLECLHVSRVPSVETELRLSRLTLRHQPLNVGSLCTISKGSIAMNSLMQTTEPTELTQCSYSTRGNFYSVIRSFNCSEMLYKYKHVILSKFH